MPQFVCGAIQRSGETGWLAVRSNSMIFIGSSSTFCRVSFWSLPISFTSSPQFVNPLIDPGFTGLDFIPDQPQDGSEEA